MMNKDEWYLVYTKPRAENKGMKNIINQGYEVFFPQIIFEKPDSKKEKLKIEPMFPRYLFIMLNKEKDNWISIKSTVGISHLVLFGNELAKVPNQVIEMLNKITDKNGFFRKRTSISVYKKGDKIKIKKGILKGREAIFLSQKSQERVKVLLGIINKEIIIDLDKSDIGKKETIQAFKL